MLQVTLSAKLREDQLSVDQQKKLIGSLTQLKVEVNFE